MLRTQAESLSQATGSVTRRISALEEYAARTRAADDALLRWQTVRRLSARGEAYRELLARTVRDDLAVTQLTSQADQARRIEAALRASVSRALKAGLALAPDPTETP